MLRFKLFFIAMTLLAAMPLAWAGVPYPRAHEPRAIDLGDMTAQQSPAKPLIFTVALKLRDAAGLSALVQQLYDPHSAQFHRFLSQQEFRARFAPGAEHLAAVRQQLVAMGFKVIKVYGNGTLLKVSAAAQDVNSAFHTSMHDYERPSYDDVPAVQFHAPTSAPVLPFSLNGSVQGVIGLDSRPRYRPLHKMRSLQLGMGMSVKESAALCGSYTCDPPGQWTVTDAAHYYNLQPLYNRGYDGTGQTIGIVTLAAFTPSDAFH